MNKPTNRVMNGGELLVWLTGSMLITCLLLLVGLLLLISINALSGFWVGDVAKIQTSSGETLGEVIEWETYSTEGVDKRRVKIKRGNRELYGEGFVWIPEDEIRSLELPSDPLIVERLEWGSFVGTAVRYQDGVDTQLVGDEIFPVLDAQVAAVHKLRKEALRISDSQIGALSRKQEDIRIQLKTAKDEKVTSLLAQKEALEARFASLERELARIRSLMSGELVMLTVDGQEKRIAVRDIWRTYQPNMLGLTGKLALYFSKLFEFLWEEPREANTEGGVFPAIFGTVLMVFIMSLFVTPLGVLAAIYLHEYAKPGPMVTLVRIAVNNLAGVPSVVFGVFGVGFFIYFIGGGIDQFFFAERLPTPTFGTGGILWASLTLALLTVPTVIVATEEGLSSIPRYWRDASYALGATKFETTWKVVLPALTPSILTGLILAIARAAGEVAPLMLTGVVKLAPALALDGSWPFLHFERKFMHLGFHIYDLGFQSPNVDASRAMVYATTLLLILLVVLLNSMAIVVRNRLRKRLALNAI